MKKWVLKAVIQKFISFFPFKHHVNYLFQKYVTKGIILTDQLFEDKLTHFKEHLEQIKESDLGQHRILEIGTGWYPVIPVGFYLAGYNDIATFDIASLATSKQIKQTCEKYISFYKRGKLNQFAPSLLPERFAKLEQILQKDDVSFNDFSMRYYVGNDISIAQSEMLYTFICSNNTFEHIHKEVLESLLMSLNKMLEKDGVMSHNIDMSDHFSHMDKTITPYHFLKFSQIEWNKIDNSIQPQNRLRKSEYINLIEKAGFKVVKQTDFKHEDISILSNKEFVKHYSSFDVSDLAIIHTYLVTKKQKK
jgi:hypothetical protein